MKITINEHYQETLENLAASHGTTPVLYATEILNGFLSSQYRESLITQVRNADVEDLKSMKEAIEPIVEDAVEAEPVVEETDEESK